MRISYLFGSPSDSKVYNKGLEAFQEAGFDSFLTQPGDGLVPFEGDLSDVNQPLCLHKDKVEVDFRCLSAHRVPDVLRGYLADWHPDIVIGGAGLTNALANACTEYAKLVIGVPIGNLDSFLSTVQSPPGYPIATVPLDRADLAVKFALRLCEHKPVIQADLAHTDPEGKMISALEELGVKYFDFNVKTIDLPDFEKTEKKLDVRLIAYQGFDKLMEFEHKFCYNGNGLFVGASLSKYASSGFDQWMCGFSNLENTLTVGAGRFENAALLAAQMLSLHDPKFSDNIRKFREPGIKKYDVWR